MRSMPRLSLLAAFAATAAPLWAQQPLTQFKQSYRSTYIASCTREFTSTPDAGSVERGATICSCVATTLTSGLDDRQLQNLDDRLSAQGTKGEAFSAIRDITGECAKPDVPGHVEKNPEHLREVLRRYPDLFK